jgi:hypothetical protein
MMRGQSGFFDLDDRYERLSAVGDPLEKLNGILPWPVLEKPLAKALKRSDGSKGRCPPLLAVMMFKILVLRALYKLSVDQAEFVIHDRLSFMRFLGLGLYDKVRMPRESNGSAKASCEPVPSTIYLPVATSISQGPATWPKWADRHATTIQAPRQRNSQHSQKGKTLIHTERSGIEAPLKYYLPLV